MRYAQRQIQEAVRIGEALQDGYYLLLHPQKVEQVYEALSDFGLSVTAYHAGMTDEQREEAQNAFMNRHADIVIATNAFGMGIDRADVRFVAHFEIPGSVEAYYQEAGRAGRDGEEAYCELLFNHADLRTQEFLLKE